MTTTEKLGRFGHHPDPAIDFCVEVEELESIDFDRSHGLGDQSGFTARLERALDFRVGGDLNAINAKFLLRDIAHRSGIKGARL